MIKPGFGRVVRICPGASSHPARGCAIGVDLFCDDDFHWQFLPYLGRKMASRNFCPIHASGQDLPSEQDTLQTGKQFQFAFLQLSLKFHADRRGY
jgi:hypothetical protein